MKTVIGKSPRVLTFQSCILYLGHYLLLGCKIDEVWEEIRNNILQE